MGQKTILLTDDEQVFLEPLADALTSMGHRVLTARTAAEALTILSRTHVDLATIDVMMPAGADYEGTVSSQLAGVFLCREVRRRYPQLDLFCISVVSDRDTIREIESHNVGFIRKGETPLRTVLAMINSRLTGLAYSTDQDKRRDRDTDR